MNTVARIGASIQIKGDVTAEEDLIIAGRVDGTLRVAGHVLSIEPGSQIAADIAARGVIIAGHVLGTVTADERIELRQSADVDGQLSTPKLTMLEGAGLHGRVQMPATLAS